MWVLQSRTSNPYQTETTCLSAPKLNCSTSKSAPNPSSNKQLQKQVETERVAMQSSTDENNALRKRLDETVSEVEELQRYKVDQAQLKNTQPIALQDHPVLH